MGISMNKFVEAIRRLLLIITWLLTTIFTCYALLNFEDITSSMDEAKRIYVAEDSTAVYFLKKFPSYTSVNRTIVSVRESKQSTTYCHPVD